MNFNVICKNDIKVEVNKKVCSLIKLFKEISIDYDPTEPILLNNIDNSHFETVLNFCKILNFRSLNLPKPLFTNKNKILSVINENEKLKDFFENLNLLTFSELIKTIDFLGVEDLEQLLYFKIYQKLCFDDKKSETLPIELNASISDEIYKKYKKYCDEFVYKLSETQVDDYLNTYK